MGKFVQYSAEFIFRIKLELLSSTINYWTYIRLKSLNILKRSRGCRAGQKVIRRRALNNVQTRISFRSHSNFHFNRGVCTNNLIQIPVNIKDSFLPSFLLSNLRSLPNKIDQARTIAKAYLPDVMLFCETWIKEVNSAALSIVNYAAYHRPRDREDKVKGGGIAVYVNEKLSVLQVNYSDIPEIEAMSIMFRPSLLPRAVPWIGLILFYYPPANGWTRETIDFGLHEVDRFLGINSKALIIISGDFNDLDVTEFDHLKNFRQIVSLPTRGNNCLDLFFTNMPDLYQFDLLPPIANSDHSTIFIKTIKTGPPQPKVVKRRVREKKASNFELMGKILVCHSWQQWYQIFDPQIAMDVFMDFMQSLVEIAFPFIVTLSKDNSLPWVNGYITELIKKRDKLYRSGPVQCSEYVLLKCKIKKAIQSEKRKICESLEYYCRHSPSQFHSKIKVLTNLSTNKKSEPIIFPNSNISQTNEEMTSFFDVIMNKHPALVFSQMRSSDYYNITPITKYEVYNYLSRLKTSASAAPEDLPPFVYKEYAILLAEPVAHLINLSLSSSYCPWQWKRGFIIPLPKVNKPSDSNFIRPIVILSPIAKLTEKKILQILIETCASKIDRFQFGGLPNRSTSQYLAILIHKIMEHLEKSKSFVTTIITDFTKAYDNVDHSLLIEKLRLLGVPVCVIWWIGSFLMERFLLVKNGEVGEKWISCQNGIPQGSVIGGFLFIALVDGLMSNSTLNLKFIDDMSLVVFQSHDKPINLLDIVQEVVNQSTDLKLPINPGKCCLLTHNFTKICSNEIVHIGNQSIPYVSQAKILGIVIQSDLKWSSHIRKIISTVNSKFFILYSLRNVGLDRACLLSLYVTYLRPHLEYCADIWGPGITVAQSAEVERIQKRAFRIILGAEYVNYQHSLSILNMSSLSDRRKQLQLRVAIQFFENFPEFKPPHRHQVSNRTTRFSNLLVRPRIKTTRFSKSPIIGYIDAINLSLQHPNQ